MKRIFSTINFNESQSTKDFCLMGPPPVSTLSLLEVTLLLSSIMNVNST
jgi:hypothetical protein